MLRFFCPEPAVVGQPLALGARPEAAGNNCWDEIDRSMRSKLVPEPPHTATARLQWPLQPHWKAPIPSSCNGSAGLGLRRLEFVRCGLLTEVWSAPPKPLPERRTNVKFAGRTRPGRHEDVATHQGYACAPSCRRRRPSYGLQFDIGQMVYYRGADSIRCGRGMGGAPRRAEAVTG